MSSSSSLECTPKGFLFITKQGLRAGSNIWRWREGERDSGSLPALFVFGCFGIWELGKTASVLFWG